MSQQPPDFSAFPILRLDQISIVDSANLEKSLYEVEQLLQAGENDNPGMYRYLSKQYEQTKHELSSRKALDRVNKLLTGAIDPFEQKDYQKEFKQRTPQKVVTKEVQKPVTHISESIPAQNEPRYKNIPIRANVKNEPKEERSESRTKAFPEKSAPNTAPAVIQSEITTESGLHNTTEGAVRSQSARSRRPRPTETPKEEQVHHEPHHHTQPTSPEQPSKKSVEMMYKNFGTEFIVAATEKKKRFYPAKKPTETIEELKTRERLDRYWVLVIFSFLIFCLIYLFVLSKIRRKIAMQRLLDRKAERDAVTQVLFFLFFFFFFFLKKIMVFPEFFV
jgi:hypothetical protein